LSVVDGDLPKSLGVVFAFNSIHITIF